MVRTSSPACCNEDRASSSIRGFLTPSSCDTGLKLRLQTNSSGVIQAWGLSETIAMEKTHRTGFGLVLADICQELRHQTLERAPFSICKCFLSSFLSSLLRADFFRVIFGGFDARFPPASGLSTKLFFGTTRCTVLTMSTKDTKLAAKCPAPGRTVQASAHG